MELSQKDAVVDALNQLGGHAHLRDIYVVAKERRKRTFPNDAKSFEAGIRGTIERFSSDSEIYGGKEDLFYSVGSKGSGHWGIRNYDALGNTIDYTSDDESFSEGKQKLRLHISKERNHSFVRKAKNAYGKSSCQICGFDFAKTYGEIGAGFIEAHHKIPMEKLLGETVVEFEDLIFVCSNCHSMLHRIRPWDKSIDTLKRTLGRR